MKKRIIIVVLALLLVTGLAGTFWGPNIAEAATGLWGSCPKGKVNDAYPGDCHDYTDTNNDDICDRSQAEPQAITTTETIATSVTTEAASTNNEQTNTDLSMATSNASSANNESYNFIPVALTTLFLYGISWILSIRKKIKELTHRKIWNVALLMTGAGSALLGLVRILILDFNVADFLPFDSLFWHVEISIVLGVAGLFHILWHWRYFTKLLKSKTG